MFSFSRGHYRHEFVENDIEDEVDNDDHHDPFNNNVFIDMPKTNNSIEGWHNALSNIYGEAHPSVFKLL